MKLRKPGRSASLLGATILLAQLTLNPAHGAGDESGKYSGTVRFSGKAGNSGIGLETTEGTAKVTWTLVEELPDVRTYTASGSISFDLAPAIEDVECTPVRITDSIDTSNKLIIYTDRANWNPNTYGFTLTAADTTTGELTTECTDEDGDSFPMTFPKFLVVGVGGNCLPDLNVRPVPMTDPEVLQGTFDCPASEFFSSLSAEWTFAGKIEEMILEITPSGGYSQWRPTAGADEGDGDPVEFTATLKTEDGGVPESHFKELEWELVDTSAEPGITINWPLQPSANPPDLYFKDQPASKPGANRRAVGEAGQKVIVTYADDGELSDSISVYPRDWGGWSTLQVTAVLKDDQRISGRLKGVSENGVRLPDRDAGRFIAQHWLEQEGISDDDRSDKDDQPKGDSNAGDGLTLYEEYRGFYVDGKRVEGDPKLKEMFVVNEGKDPGSAGTMPGRAGITLFQKITSLRVHGTLKREEMDANRVVNHNASTTTPRLGSQHAVLIKVDPKLKGQANAFTANGRPNTPRGIEYIGLPLKFPDRPTTSPTTSYASITVAHELLHAVNVYHHGESDKVVWWSYDADGRLLEQDTVERENDVYIPVGAATEIRLFLESGEDVTAGARTGARNLGTRRGQHSGDEYCVMRYDIADAYVSIANPNHRYVGTRETQGSDLDNSAEGSYTNAHDWVPQSRYGQAAEHRGNCAAQILVNDMIRAPLR